MLLVMKIANTACKILSHEFHDLAILPNKTLKNVVCRINNNCLLSENLSIADFGSKYEMNDFSLNSFNFKDLSLFISKNKVMCNLPFFCYGNLKFTLQGIPVNDRNVDNLGYEPKVAVQNNLISLSGWCLKL